MRTQRSSPSRCTIGTPLLISLLCLSGAAHADIVTDWNANLLQAIRTGATNPPLSSRTMAMTHIAIYDAVNAIDRAEGTSAYKNYHYNTAGPIGASREAAAAQAAYTILRAAYPAQAATLDTALATSLATIPDGAAKNAGIALGSAVGSATITLRTGDGSVNTLPPYTGGTNPGDWRPTPPGNLNGLLPNWPGVTPFSMTSGSQFRQGPPPALTSAEYTADFNEVKEIGSATSLTRTAEQTNIAQFWADSGGTSTPPGHWNRIAQTVGGLAGNTLSENARMFALLNISLADASIACWDMKYTYSFWRPVTAIRLADTDGNDLTTQDTTWSSLITTPPFPTYTSGHSTFSMTAATVLGEFLGTDSIAFTSSPEGAVVPDRSYTSLTQAALEAGRSRIYGGIHFEFDNTVGADMGRQIGLNTMGAVLSAPEPGTLALLGLLAAPAGLLLRRRR